MQALAFWKAVTLDRAGVLEDVLRGKVWAAQDPTPRGSKRQEDMADTARLVEAFPALREQAPPELRERLF